MKICLLTFIVENLNSLEKAEKVSELIGRKIGAVGSADISKYHKFPNSYKIEFTDKVPAEADSLRYAVELSAKIASPWLIWYDEEAGEPELIFNKADYVRFELQELNVIRWANLIITA